MKNENNSKEVVEKFKLIAKSENSTFIALECLSYTTNKHYEMLNDIFNIYYKHFEEFEKGLKAKIIQKIDKTLKDMNTKEIFNHTPALKKLYSNTGKEVGVLSDIYAELLLNCSDSSRPLILFFNNIKWIDNRMLNIIINVVNQISNYPVLILGVYYSRTTPDNVSKILSSSEFNQ